jgi:hypothetical protein
VFGHAHVPDSVESSFARTSDPRIQDVHVAAIESIHDLALGVLVDALVEPCFFKLVGGHHAIPILVSEFMFDNTLRNFSNHRLPTT